MKLWCPKSPKGALCWALLRMTKSSAMRCLIRERCGYSMSAEELKDAIPRMKKARRRIGDRQGCTVSYVEARDVVVREKTAGFTIVPVDLKEIKRKRLTRTKAKAGKARRKGGK